MICVTIGRTRHKRTIAEHQRLAELGAELVELRLDYIGRSVDLSRILKDRPTPVVITCRRRADGGRWEKSEVERLMLLRSAIAMGVEYVDLEEDIADKIQRYGSTKRIISHHDFEETPTDIAQICERLASKDADIVKIATMANSFDDVVAMLHIMEQAKRPTIGISMGDIGTITRVLGPRYGAPFSYCSYSSERRIAPGQLTFDQMHSLYNISGIDEQTQLFGVIADPVAQSMSPLIHNHAFETQGINARYLPFRVPASELEFFMRWAQAYPMGGLSVTIPHKETILPLLSQAESAAQGIGAANTVIFAGREAAGYNTDYRAAMECLDTAMAMKSKDAQPFKDKTVLLLGAGGVSRAIGYGLKQRGANVLVCSRTEIKSHALAQAIGGKPLDWSARYSVDPAMVVNGTPVGMFPDVDETPYDGARLNEGTIVFDTIYNPESTLLVRRAREQGCIVITGVDMFIRQACYQYKLFTGKEPPVAEMQKVLRKAISPVSF